MITAPAVKRRARELGFDLCGIAAADAFPELARLPEWLAAGRAGEMVYLHKSAATRADIRAFLPAARSVIVTGTYYNVDETLRTAARDEPPDRAVVARYARGRDYHVVLAERLDALVAWMREQAGADHPVEAAIFVDKHHVQERVYAARAGLGWVGKNTCVINPARGSWFFIAGVACSEPLDPDPPVTDHCGACTLCLDACPTGALVEPFVLDATRCIAYLTIELAGPIPEPLRPAIGPHVFGCDICQEVCPWNLAPLPSADAAWQPRGGRDAAEAGELWTRTDQELHAFVEDSALLHTSLARLRRNLAVVIGNSADARLAEALEQPGRGVRNAAHSASTPLVRDHVSWARRRLAGGPEPV
ncbi:MAG: tRNA epoxyqueuosine(34) reductase QueG [Acidobacteriota bacterium]